MGGAFGFGLKRNVLGLYKFLCRSYRSKEDYEQIAKGAGEGGNDGKQVEIKNDDIFLFGFSRGAFTVRVLSGLMLSQALVRYTSEKELDHRARAAYRAYRASRQPKLNLEYPSDFCATSLRRTSTIPRTGL